MFKKLSAPVRVNTTNWVFFEIDNAAELKKIAEEVSGSLNADYFLSNIYNKAVHYAPYSFLHIHNNRSLSDGRFSINWDIPIKVSAEQSMFSVASKKIKLHHQDVDDEEDINVV